tara:strand:- start:1991 stop:2311 length:321 start_codon:yes stop_codon:yes gene_type:complete
MYFNPKGAKPMTKLTIVASIKANPDQIGLLKAELEKLVAVSRAEPGCINYDLHQDNENPAHFMFYENWESRGHWQTHMKAPHLAAYAAATQGAVAEATLIEMTHIS